MSVCYSVICAQENKETEVETFKMETVLLLQTTLHVWFIKKSEIDNRTLKSLTSEEVCLF